MPGPKSPNINPTLPPTGMGVIAAFTYILFVFFLSPFMAFPIRQIDVCHGHHTGVVAGLHGKRPKLWKVTVGGSIVTLLVLTRTIPEELSMFVYSRDVRAHEAVVPKKNKRIREGDLIVWRVHPLTVCYGFCMEGRGRDDERDYTTTTRHVLHTLQSRAMTQSKQQAIRNP